MRDDNFLDLKTDRQCLLSCNAQVPEPPGRTTATGSDRQRSVKVAAMTAGLPRRPEPSIVVVILQTSAFPGRRG